MVHADELTPIRRFLLRDAIPEAPLMSAPMGWVPVDIAPYPNEFAPYVPELIEAARVLLNLGLIEMWDEEGDSVLPFEEVLAVVLNPENWWAYDPESDWDPNRVTPSPEGWNSDGPDRFVSYTVAATDDGLRVPGLWPDRPEERGVSPRPPR